MVSWISERRKLQDGPFLERWPPENACEPLLILLEWPGATPLFPALWPGFAWFACPWLSIHRSAAKGYRTVIAIAVPEAIRSMHGHRLPHAQRAQLEVRLHPRRRPAVPAQSQPQPSWTRRALQHQLFPCLVFSMRTCSLEWRFRGSAAHACRIHSIFPGFRLGVATLHDLTDC